MADAAARSQQYEYKAVCILSNSVLSVGFIDGQIICPERLALNRENPNIVWIQQQLDTLNL